MYGSDALAHAGTIAKRTVSRSRSRDRRLHDRPTLAAQGDEKLVQLLERLAKPTCTPGGDGTIESFLRGIEVVHDEQGLGTLFFEGRRSAGPKRGREVMSVNLASTETYQATCGK